MTSFLLLLPIAQLLVMRTSGREFIDVKIFVAEPKFYPDARLGVVPLIPMSLF